MDSDDEIKEFSLKYEEDVSNKNSHKNNSVETKWGNHFYIFF